MMTDAIHRENNSFSHVKNQDQISCELAKEQGFKGAHGMNGKNFLLIGSENLEYASQELLTEVEAFMAKCQQEKNEITSLTPEDLRRTARD